MEYTVLNKIKSPEQVKQLNNDEIDVLCNEIRDCLINTISKNGGHLASNLGAVELTVAIHRVFNSPEDAVIFDVGHQSYTHKLLTGRYDKFDTIRKENGLSGFMRPSESEHDPFITGHSSNSISAAYGIYRAKALSGESGTAIAVIGDGAMTGGMAFEALNNAGNGHGNFIVILNDNKMSISRNVGALARYLNIIRSKKNYHRFKYNFKNFLKKIPFIGNWIYTKLFKSKTALKNALYHSNIFEGLGFSYLGPVDGHDVAKIENILNIAKTQSRPVLVHVLTTKGKGYTFAEESPRSYHGVGSFNVENGNSNSSQKTYSDVCGNTLCNIAENDKKICAVTAAMKTGTGLSQFAEKYKNRFFDVGIAEEHAMTFSAGLVTGGMKPYFVVYSSFFQRAYDQLLHDAAIAGLSLKLCIDRAGVVGEDGETHQGVFDVALLNTIPGISVYSPASFDELEKTLTYINDLSGISAIRYPRGNEGQNSVFKYTGTDYSVYNNNSDTVVVTYGRLSANGITAAKNTGSDFMKLNKICPIEKVITEKLLKYKRIFFFEEGIKNGGVAESVGNMLLENGYKGNYNVRAIENKFVSAADVETSLKRLGMDAESMTRFIEVGN